MIACRCVVCASSPHVCSACSKLKSDPHKIEAKNLLTVSLRKSVIELGVAHFGSGSSLHR